MIRIANGQGFWGDSLEAPLEQIRRGPIDYLTLDYLAEVTMSILQKQRSRDPRSGYARDFVDMVARGGSDILARNIKVVANAGGVNPESCREAVAKVLGSGLAGTLCSRPRYTRTAARIDSPQCASSKLGFGTHSGGFRLVRTAK